MALNKFVMLHVKKSIRFIKITVFICIVLNRRVQLKHQFVFINSLI